MRKNAWMFAASAALLLASPHRLLIAQDSATVPVHLVVSADSTKDASAPQKIDKSNVNVKQGKNLLQVTDWIAAQGDAAALQLFILIDDTCTTELGQHLDEIRNFIKAQPPSTLVALGYMSNSTVNIIQDFSADHEKVAGAVRLPFGRISASDSPYLSLIDLLKRWPPGKVRREVIMVTDGINRIREFGTSSNVGAPPRGPGRIPGNPAFGSPLNPTVPYISPDVDAASMVSQRTGVIVHTIYAPGVGRAGRNYFELTNGQNQISKLSEETGGESFFLGLQQPVSLQPFLDRIQTVLNSQYYLVFRARPGKKSDLQRVKLSTEVPDVELVSADNVWVPAPSSLSKEKEEK
ncbi:MAG: hypothetical protein JO300_07870 [Silvibacterium sp.]|nr:hypothetical protein [Silvibacterium sp.]